MKPSLQMSLCSDETHVGYSVLEVSLSGEFDYSHEILGMDVYTPLQGVTKTSGIVETTEGIRGLPYTEEQSKIAQAIYKGSAGAVLAYEAQYPKNVPTNDSPYLYKVVLPTPLMEEILGA